MAKPELGTKRICPVTGRKFYDLNKDPVISPYTGEVVPVAPVVTRARPEAKPAAAPAVAPAAEPELETAEAEGAEFVSLEEADAEAQGKQKAPAGDTAAEGEDEIEVADDESMDDDAFIEEQEEGDADVTDIIGETIEKEEET